MGLLDAFRRRGGAEPDLPDWPRATGPAREVDVVIASVSTGEGRRFLPTDDRAHVGALLDVEVIGPTLLRPGGVEDPVAAPVHRIAELTLLRQGAVEHRDSLGHRGLLRGPAARLVSGGAGIISELGPAREVRRDGGHVEQVTVRWAQPGAVTPTVRIVEELPASRQGRSTVVPVVGPDAALPSSGGLQALHVTVAEGATVDLAIPHGHDVAVAVLSGEALVGEALTPVASGRLAVLRGEGTRLTAITRLEGAAGATLLVLASPPDADPRVRSGLLLADDADEVEAVRESAASGAFGRLPRLDG